LKIFYETGSLSATYIGRILKALPDNLYQETLIIVGEFYMNNLNGFYWLKGSLSGLNTGKIELQKQ